MPSNQAELTSSIQNAKELVLDVIGQEVFVGDWYEISQDKINHFGDVTEDTQWIHTDPERAATDSPFKATIAHGFLTLSMVTHLTNGTNEKNPLFPPCKMTVNYGLNRVRFPYPVKAGSRVRARVSFVEIEDIRRGLELVSEVTIEIENARRAACIAELVTRLYF